MGSSLPLVSIMIPCYNQENFIGRALQSALDQDYTNIEIIVSDDNSKDQTEAVVNSFSQFKRIKYVKHHNQLGRVRNYRKLVFELAHGTYAINLDGDDFFNSKNFISKAVTILENHSKCNLVFGRQQFMDLQSQRVWCNPPPNLPDYMTAQELLLALPHLKEVMPHVASLYRRQAALDADIFADDIVFADAQALIKVAASGDVAFLNEIVGTWVRNGLNESYKPAFEMRTKNFRMIDEPSQYFLNRRILSEREVELWKMQMATKLGRETACLYLDFKDQKNYLNLLNFLENNYGYDVRNLVQSDLRVRLRRWIPGFSRISELLKSFLNNKG